MKLKPNNAHARIGPDKKKYKWRCSRYKPKSLQVTKLRVDISRKRANFFSKFYIFLEKWSS
jgi:hypothetical protein